LQEAKLIPVEDPEAKFEIDILCIQDGKLIIGESKSNNKLDKAQLNTYVDFVNRLRAQFVFSTSSGDVESVKKPF